MKPPRSVRRTRGFTLIELMVSIVPGMVVSGAAVAFDVTGEHVVIAVVIAHAGQVTSIADGGGTQRGAVFAVTPGQLFGKVHGVAHGAAIAA